MPMHSAKNHSLSAYFDEVIPTCFRGPVFFETVYYTQDDELSQRNRAAGCIIVLAKSGRLELEDNILRTL